MNKSYSGMNIKEKIEYDYGGTQLTDDCNHAIRRFFRCWLDGSYNGEQHYKRNCEYLWENRDNNKALRSFVIREFVEYTASDYGCSYSHAQNCIMDSMTTFRLEQLNELLIADALDLIEHRLSEEDYEDEEFLHNHERGLCEVCNGEEE